MNRHTIMLACALAIGVNGCTPPPPRTVSMRVKGGSPNAVVHIDDMYIGNFAMVQQRGVALPPGKHRITVELSGHFPWDKLVEVQEGDPPVILDIELKRIPD